MKNIIEIQTILNQIPAPLVIQVSRYHSGDIFMFISFNINETIQMSSYIDLCVIPESINPFLVQFDIKIETLKTILTSAQNQLNKFTDIDFNFLHQYLLAKDMNQFYYQIPRNNNVSDDDNSFSDNAPLFFSGQAVTWQPFNINSENKE